jgi:hypothetical protein
MKPTKKYITSVLRTLNRTAIFKLFRAVSCCNGKIDKGAVYDFIKKHAPTKRVANAAWDIAYNSPHDSIESVYKGKYGHFAPLPRQEAVDYTKKQVKTPSAYAKYPIKGHTHLYFASVSYGHKDYNKWQSVPLKGNERFVDALIRYVKKFNISGY